jgi:hypothetical protein
VRLARAVRRRTVFPEQARCTRTRPPARVRPLATRYPRRAVRRKEVDDGGEVGAFAAAGGLPAPPGGSVFVGGGVVVAGAVGGAVIEPGV